MPRVDSIPTAAIPIPYNPMPAFEKSNPEANRKDRIIPMTTEITGITVEIIPIPRPEMITVAGPVSELLAILWVGAYSSEV